MASRWARKRSSSPSAPMAGPRTRSSWCRTACASISREGIGARGAELREAWDALFEAYRSELSRARRCRSTACRSASCPRAGTRTCRLSRPTQRAWPRRDASGKVLNAIAQHYPWLIGGAADLAPSTKTRLTFDGAGDFEADERYGGRNLHFGIREHAMGGDRERPGAVEDCAPTARPS